MKIKFLLYVVLLCPRPIYNVAILRKILTYKFTKRKHAIFWPFYDLGTVIPSGDSVP